MQSHSIIHHCTLFSCLYLLLKMDPGAPVLETTLSHQYRPRKMQHCFHSACLLVVYKHGKVTVCTVFKLELEGDMLHTQHRERGRMSKCK